MKVGLVGYAGSGKTTVFQWLTGVEPDPSRIQQGQTGMAAVPDERLDKMSAKFKPKKTKFAEIAFLDTPGLMLDERKDNPRRLAILREANGLVVVLDGYSGADLMGQLRSFREDLLFADLEIVMNRVDRVAAQLKKQARPVKEKEADEVEMALLRRIQGALEAGESTTTLGLREDEEKVVRSFQLLTLKPELVLVNQGDAAAAGPLPTPTAIAAPVKLERELEELDEESRAAFMADLGIAGSSRNQVLRDIFYGMGRIVFFTVGEDECRSWPLNKGATAVEGAAVIHTDLARTFIRAEVMSYADFEATGYSEKDCKAKGTFRLESKDYVVQDGDIMHIRANA
jgi:ribosome-binding ATPase YchF (GTP1/OBG family)